MRLLIVRHGDPDYEKDSLTEKGYREAELLAERLSKMNIAAFYMSPLGRARETARITLEKMNRTAQVCDWLQEFPYLIDRPDMGGKDICWDFLPREWTEQKEYFAKDAWYLTDKMKDGNIQAGYRYVTESLDALLARHGYERDGEYYRAVRPNRDVIVLFCHFGLECVLLSHLMNVSPMILWHHTCAAPTSVTGIVTEERRKGQAIFRMSEFGDISHLYAGNEAPAFAARFCETFDSDERHD